MKFGCDVEHIQSVTWCRQSKVVSCRQVFVHTISIFKSRNIWPLSFRSIFVCIRAWHRCHQKFRLFSRRHAARQRKKVQLTEVTWARTINSNSWRRDNVYFGGEFANYCSTWTFVKFGSVMCSIKLWEYWLLRILFRYQERAIASLRIRRCGCRNIVLHSIAVSPVKASFIVAVNEIA